MLSPVDSHRFIARTAAHKSPVRPLPPGWRLLTGRLVPFACRAFRDLFPCRRSSFPRVGSSHCRLVDSHGCRSPLDEPVCAADACGA